MNEVAFTVMDLVDHGSPRLAGRFLDALPRGDRRLRRARVPALLPRLPRDGAREGRLHARAPAPRARRSARRPSGSSATTCGSPSAVVAPSGGRSCSRTGSRGRARRCVSGRLVEAIGAVRVRSDVERKRLHGLAAGARRGAALGGGIYGARTPRAAPTRGSEIARAVARAGFPAIVDATFLRRAERDALRALAREAGRGLRDRRVRGAASRCCASASRAGARRRRRVGRDPRGARAADRDREPLAGDERAFAFRSTRRRSATRSAACPGARRPARRRTWRSTPS